MKNIITSFIFTAATAALPLLAVAQTGEITFMPNQVEVNEGESFEVMVEFNTNTIPVSVFDLHMRFDPQYVQVTGIENLQGDLFNYHLPPAFDNANGKIDMAGFQIGKSLPAGNFSLIKITFLALQPTDLTSVTHPEDVFPRTILAFEGTDVLGETGDLKITINGESLGAGSNGNNAIHQLSLWPNPSSDQVSISFSISKPTLINLSVFDVHGKLVSTIYNGLANPDQARKIDFDVSGLANGNYACRLVADGLVQTKLLVVAR